MTRKAVRHSVNNNGTELEQIALFQSRKKFLHYCDDLELSTSCVNSLLEIYNLLSDLRHHIVYPKES